MNLKSLTLLATLCVSVTLSSAADPACKYRKARGLSIHWPDPTDCARFYRCSARGIKREVVCPTGKVYQAKTGKCVTKRRGICLLSKIAPLTDVDNVCSEAVDGAFMAQIGHCRDFYICHDKQAYPQSCDSGSYFNPVSSGCEPDKYNSCWQNACVDVADGTYKTDPASCTNFYLCNAGNVVVQTCSTGAYFNPTLTVCEPDTDNMCWENLCLSKAEGSFVADSDNCKDFYVCNNQKPIKQSCPVGSYFSVKDLACLPGDCSDVTTTTETTCETTDAPTEESTCESTEPPTEAPCESTEPSTVEPPTEEPCASTEPATVEPATETPCESTEPSTLEPLTEVPCESTEPSTVEPATETPCESTEPSTIEPLTEEPCESTEPSTIEPLTEEPCESTEPSTVEPLTEEPCESTEPSTVEPLTEEPCASTEPSTVEPLTEEPCESTEPPTAEPCESTEPPTVVPC